MKKDNLKISYAEETDPFFKRVFIKTVEHLSGRKKIDQLYNEAHKVKNLQHVDRWRVVLETLKVKVKYDESQLAKVPKGGPLLMIANHPFGILDGLIFGYLAALARPKFKILVNSVLEDDHMLEEYFLPIDFRETREAMMVNIKTKNEAIKELKEGGTVLIFPAGGVSTATRVFNEPKDTEWKIFVTKLIHKSKATVVPLFFHGRNSRLFQLASNISLSFRVSMLLNEVRNKIGKEFEVEIGDSISFDELNKIKNRQELLAHLRNETYKLKQTKIKF